MRLLSVCTGNICRSSVAEYVLRALLGSSSPNRIESAGTSARAGMPMTTGPAALVHEYGDPALEYRPRSRLLTGSLIDGHDLILTMTRDQRRVAVGLAPRRLRVVFTLREFVALAGAVDGVSRPAGATSSSAGRRSDQLIGAIGKARYLVDPVQNQDIADPVGRGQAAYRRLADQPLPALSVIQHVFSFASRRLASHQHPIVQLS